MDTCPLQLVRGPIAPCSHGCELRGPRPCLRPVLAHWTFLPAHLEGQCDLGDLLDLSSLGVESHHGHPLPRACQVCALCSRLCL